MEDNAVNQQVARRMLESLGCSVEIAEDGVKALDAIQRNAYDLVFMDCQMPRMDGYEATSALRDREGAGRHTIVVALTASAMQGDAQRCYAAGMDAYLAKPVRIEDFKSMLDHWLKTSDGESGASRPVINLTAVPSGSAYQRDGSDLLELFLSTAKTQIQSMYDALGRGELALLAGLGHTVRGSALSVGANGLAAACESLERRCGDSNNKGSIESYVDAVEIEFDQVRRFIASQPGS